MNAKKETIKIQVNNGKELIAKAQEYKNSGGEWKLREKYLEHPDGKVEKRKNKLGWGIVIGKGKQAVDIYSINGNLSKEAFNNEIEARPELHQLFPEIKGAYFASDQKNGSWGDGIGRPYQSRLDNATFKSAKKNNETFNLVRYLVAEKSWHLQRILFDYVRENETKIYQSANPYFGGWVEIVDGQDGNVYLYVGEKNENGGREIKVGITKSEFEKLSRASDNTPTKCLEDFWSVFAITLPRTPAEEREYYSKTGGLEQEWQRNWPHRKGLCRKYLEELVERFCKKGAYWHEINKSKNYQDEEANQEFFSAKARIGEIGAFLADMKRNRPEYYNACDKDCSVCGVKLCCHFEGKACSGDNCLTRPDENLLHFYGRPYEYEPKENKNNQLTQAEKTQLLQFFLDHHISKISIENGQLKIEYSQQGAVKINDNSELEKYRNFIENSPYHSLSLSDLQPQNNSQTNTPNNNKLWIGLTIGAGATILVGIIFYFWKNRRQKRD